MPAGTRGQSGISASPTETWPLQGTENQGAPVSTLNRMPSESSRKESMLYAHFRRDTGLEEKKVMARLRIAGYA